MKNTLVSLIAAAIMAVSGCVSANPMDLPNDCAIVATEAHSRLRDSAVWDRIIFFKAIDLATLRGFGHAITVWQIEKGGPIYVYDAAGTIQLKTHSRKLADIITELQDRIPSVLFIEAFFAQ